MARKLTEEKPSVYDEAILSPAQELIGKLSTLKWKAQRGQLSITEISKLLSALSRALE